MRYGLVLCFLGLWTAPMAIAGSLLLPPCSDAPSNWRGRCLEKVFFPNGTIYFGEMLNGLFHGEGTLNFGSNEIYVGQFFRGKRSGPGVYRYPDGRVYVGEWHENLYEGPGLLTFPDGKAPLEGIFERGRLVNARKVSDEIVGRTKDSAMWVRKQSVIKQEFAPLYAATKKCEELGITKNTEKFGECVLRLSR